MQLKTTSLVTAASLAMIVCVVAMPPASAQMKIGIVDFQNALLATAEMTKKAADLEIKYKPKQQELDSKGKELQDLQAKIESSTNQQETVQMQADFGRIQRDAQRMSEDLQADVDYDRNAILQAGADRMRAVVDSVREEKGLDIVVEIGSTLSFTAALDITSDVTAAYDAAHPAQ